MPVANRRSGPTVRRFRGVSDTRNPLLHSRRSARETMNNLGKNSAYVALFSEIGFVLLIVILAGVLGGYWLDQRLGTVPIFALIGFTVGFVSGSVACWRLIARFLAQMDEEDKN